MDLAQQNAMIRVSIHAPAKGATSTSNAIMEVWRSFNPRSREGSDDAGAEEAPAPEVSIHAPAKGATI